MRFLIYCSVLCCAFYLNAFSNSQTPSTPCEPDTSASVSMQEDDFQNNLNSFFDSESTSIDTFAWNTKKINSGRFDWSAWNDTAKIVLVDSLLNKHYVHPFKNCVTSDFGFRKWLFHYGIDIRLRKGDTVNCAFDGIVRVIENDRHGYGKVVVVRHPDGIETLYGHLSKTSVSINQNLKAGDVVGLGGNSGHSTGSHLHFETRFYGQAFDPNYIIDFENYSLKNDTLVLSKDNFEYLTEAHKITWHIVKKGDTIGRLARRFHTKINVLCQANNMRPHTRLRVGQKLAINPTKRGDETFILKLKNSKV